MIKKIALSVGDPASVAVISALFLIDNKLSQTQSDDYSLFIFADLNWLREVCRNFLSNLTHLNQVLNDEILANQHQIYFHHYQLNRKPILTQPDSANSSYIFNCFKKAIEFVENNNNSALVTGPVDKSIIQSSQAGFIGHTQFLTERYKKPTLMNFVINNFFENEKKDLSIALANDHISLIKSINTLKNQSFLLSKIELFCSELTKKFAIKNPKVGILGLNPHAGEKGSIGQEEIKYINPVIKKLQNRGLEVSGPIGADSALFIAREKKLDGLFSLYHDQLLPAVKFSFFNQSINTTLGLDMIRTSVDHGTAYHLANQQKFIESKPLINAVNQALRMIEIQINRKKNNQ